MVCEYRLEYLGKFDVPSLTTSGATPVGVVDNIVAKVRESQKSGSVREKPKRRSLSAMFKGIGKPSSKDSDATDRMAASNSATSLFDENESCLTATDHSTSSLSLQSQEEKEDKERERDGGASSSADISTEVTSSEDITTSPMDVHRSIPQEEGTANGGVNESCSSFPNLLRIEVGEEKPGAVNGVMETKVVLVNGSLPSAELDTGQKKVQNGVEAAGEEGQEGEAVRADSVCSEFDTLPELANLRDSYAFQALSLTQNQRVKLVFSGLTVVIFSECGGEQLLNLHLRNISCCAQVSTIDVHQSHIASSPGHSQIF